MANERKNCQAAACGREGLMAKLITAYSKEAYRDFLLPSVNNADHVLVIHKSRFGLLKDLRIHLEILEGCWRICPGEGYILRAVGEVISSPVPIQAQDIYRLLTDEGEQITLLCRGEENLLEPCALYRLEPGQEITVGRLPQNTLCYNNRDLVAREHAVLQMSRGGWEIRNKSRNGLYVNGSFVKESSRLLYGDDINIVGLHLVFLGDILAVQNRGLETAPSRMFPYKNQEGRDVEDAEKTAAAGGLSNNTTKKPGVTGTEEGTGSAAERPEAAAVGTKSPPGRPGLTNVGPGAATVETDASVDGAGLADVGPRVAVDGAGLADVGPRVAVNGAGLADVGARVPIGVPELVDVGPGAAVSGDGKAAAKNGSAVTMNDSGGAIIVHRSPREVAPLDTTPVEIEDPPPMPGGKKQSLLMTVGPSVSMVIPMSLGSLMMIYAARSNGGSTSLFMYSGLVMAASSAAVAASWGVINRRAQEKSVKKETADREKSYRAYIAGKESEVRRRYLHNKQVLLECYPDSKTLARTDEHSSLLWNRNKTHDDFLKHRIGIGELPFQAPVVTSKERFMLHPDPLYQEPQRIRQSYQTMTDVPVLSDLTRYPLIGLVGGSQKQGAYETARLLTVQMAAVNCYTDVKLAFVYNEDDSFDALRWRFARWLPHVWNKNKSFRYVAANRAEAGDVFYELSVVLRKRLENPDARDEEEPFYVLFLSDYSLLENDLIKWYVEKAHFNADFTVLLLSDTPENLPNSCEWIIRNDECFHGMYQAFARQPERIPVRFDQVSDQEAEMLSRSLAAMEVHGDNAGGEIPESLTFFEMLGIDHPEELHSADRWRKNRTCDHIRGIIGQKASGVPCVLDVHEKAHGPHGLAAGTTGSGKSELLQTYLLSLAVNYSPRDVVFFIIDYKGGGMANLFNGLPHMAGQISNLSGSQVRRAMISIKSENRRRQKRLMEFGVNHIDAYTRLFRNGEASLPMPHLFIIIDEFAELKKEEPDFMRELISVAQVGRSLGVHLILATQKPGGTVDENIRSNARFRLCLRVQDRSDSQDMLHVPDAADITRAGRAFLQVGNNEVFEAFQAGYSGAPYRKDQGAKKEKTCILLTNTGQADMTAGQPDMVHTDEKEITQLEAVCGYLRQIAREMRIPQAGSLYLAPLPERISLENLKEFNSLTGHGTGIQNNENLMAELPGNEKAGIASRVCVSPDAALSSLCRAEEPDLTLGIVDDPWNQEQRLAKITLSKCGHLAVCGMAGSGKSTFLQTLVMSAITSYSVDELNVYLLDFGGRMLRCFAGDAHVGGVMDEEDFEKTSRFFTMMDRILTERKKDMGEDSGHPSGLDRPRILIVLDNYASFREKTGDAFEENMLLLSREGAGYGIHLAVSAGGFGSGGIPPRTGANLSTVFCLEMADRYAYSEILRSARIEVRPAAGVRGRGLLLEKERALEFQTALPVDETDAHQRNLKIADKIRDLNRKNGRRHALPVPELPEHPVWLDFARLSQVLSAAEASHLLPVGYNTRDADVFSLNLRNFYCFLITGTRKSGKKNFLKIMILSSLLKGAKVCVIDSPSGAFRPFTESLGLQRVCDEESLFRYFKETLTDVFQKRNKKKNELCQEGRDEAEIFAEMSKEKPVFHFITDLEWFFETVCRADSGMNGFVETIFEKGALHNIFFAGILPAEKKSAVQSYPAFQSFVRDKTGIHFGGNVAKAGILNFSYLRYAEQNKPQKPGIGMLPDTGEVRKADKILVPLARIFREDMGA